MGSAQGGHGPSWQSDWHGWLQLSDLAHRRLHVGIGSVQLERVAAMGEAPHGQCMTMDGSRGQMAASDVVCG